MPKMRLISFLLFSIIIVIATSNPQQYQPITTFSLPPNLQKLTYSHNQRLLVGYQSGSQGEFFVFDGLKLSDQKTITLTDERKQRVSPSTFAFSANDDLLLVGSKQGGVYGFKIVNNTISATYDYSFVIGSAIEQNWIRVIAFSPSGQIAISSKMSMFILARQQSTGNLIQILNSTFTHTIYTLSWSILEPTVVIVGTLGMTQGEFLMFDVENNKTTSINKDKTEVVAMFPDGKTILKATVGKDVEVYTYQVGAVPILVTTIKDTNDTKEMYVAKNGLYFALRTNAGMVKAWYVQNNVAGSLLTNLKNQDLNTLNDFLPSLSQPGKTLAFSESGGDILIIPNGDSGEISKFSLCLNRTYFNQQSLSCEACSQSCNNCFDTQTCITCNPDKFISGYQCKLCGSKLDGCITCSSQDTCLTCDQNQQWKPQAQGGKCQCQDTFYNEQGKCSTCSVFLDCLDCAGPNNCTSCKDEGNFNPQPIGGLCLCKDTYWLNKTECAQCSSSIVDCQSCTQDGEKCTQCLSPDRKPNAQQIKCVCVDFKYEDQSTKKCEFCDPDQNCISCQPQSPHKCLKCDTQKHFQQEPNADGTCVCSASYFIDNGKCNLCSEAMVDCQLCDERQKCSLCKDENNFNPNPVDGKCVCNEKWILVDKACELCSNQINGCLTCSSQTVCTTCDENAHFNKNPDGGNCKCMAQYWLNDKVCSLCNSKITGCKTCSEDGSKCLTCEEQSRQPSLDGQSCVCKPFTYENQDKTCQPCDTKHACINCSPNGNHECTACDIDGHWNPTPVQGECKCQDGFNEYDNKCIFCLVPGCTVCPSQSICQQCSTTKKFQPIPIHNECKCTNGTRISDNKTECIDCNTTILGCKQCSNAHNCEVCDQINHFVINPTTDDCHCDKGWYLKSSLCHDCVSAIDNCLYCSADVNGNNVQCSKCRDGWGTASNKKSCVSCRDISPGCIGCDQSNKCTTCDEQHNFVLDGNTCSCNQKYYLNGEQCALCFDAIPGCLTCDDQATCTSCTADGKFNPVPVNHKCDCLSGWILDQGKCISCQVIAGCVTCSDVQTCTVCDENGHFELTKDNKCQCQTGYWNDGMTCKLCNQKISDCLQCSQDGNTCSKCSDPNRVLNNQKNICVCKQFMFENLQKECEFCDPYQNCKQCTDKDTCTSCDVDKKWVQQPVNGQCVCQAGYQQWNGKCLLCQVNGCLQCHQENACFKCSTVKKFAENPIKGVCECQQNTFIDGDQCYECEEKMVGCQQCLNLNQCTSCNEKNYFILNQTTSKCQCDPNHYFVSPNCIACSQAIAYCSECNIDDNHKQCTKCQPGFIIDTQTTSHCLSCQQLIIGCFACTSTTTCTQCNTNGNFQPFESECICKKGYFLQDIQCISCSEPIPGCVDCDKEGKQCGVCDEEGNFVVNGETGKCDCVKGFYLNQHQCDQCVNKLVGCAECVGDGSICLICQQGFYLLEGQCLPCSTKTPGCTQCSLNGQQCSQCNTQHFIFNPQTLKCDCQPTYFLSQSSCKLCSSALLSCKSCTIDGSKCLQCQGDKFVLNPQTNLCECVEGYYVHGNKTCEVCGGVIAGCERCDQQGVVCFKCNDKENFVLDSTSCSCIDGYFLNRTQKNCNLCSVANPGCTRCSSDGQQSFQCNMSNFILNPSTKRCQCSAGYYTASNTQCRLCSESIEYCSSCSSSSAENNLVKDFTATCNQCEDTFTLSEDRMLCACVGDNKEIANGICRDKQSSSSWLLYGGVAVGVIVVVGAGVLVYLRRRKAKLVKLDRYNELEQETDINRTAKPQTILTADSGDKMQFNSSDYKLEDEQ